MSPEHAIEEIKELSGTQFDPDLTTVFISLVQRLLREHENLDEFLGRGARNSPFIRARCRIRELVGGESSFAKSFHGYTKH